MKAIMPNVQADSATPLYLQLYEYIKALVLDGGDSSIGKASFAEGAFQRFGSQPDYR